MLGDDGYVEAFELPAFAVRDRPPAEDDDPPVPRLEEYRDLSCHEIVKGLLIVNPQHRSDGRTDRRDGIGMTGKCHHIRVLIKRIYYTCRTQTGIRTTIRRIRRTGPRLLTKPAGEEPCRSEAVRIGSDVLVFESSPRRSESESLGHRESHPHQVMDAIRMT